MNETLFQDKRRKKKKEGMTYHAGKSHHRGTLFYPPSKSATKAKRHTFDCINNLMFCHFFPPVGIVAQL